MNLSKRFTSICLLLTVAISVMCGQRNGAGKVKASDPGSLPAKIRRFSPTVLTANAYRLTPKDRFALRKIIAAAKLFDPLFLRQLWSGNEALMNKLEADMTVIG